MAIDKTNNLAAFLDDVADGIRVAETGLATPDNNDIPAQSFRSRIETLPARVRPDVARAGTTVTVTADDTNDTLTISASNNQSTGYVTGADKTASTTVTLTASGPEVTATATDGTKVSKSVATVTRANTTLSSVANTTNNTLDFTASNNQGTGYVTGANKTATRSVSLRQSGATVTATDGTNYISTSIPRGSYFASGGGLSAGSGSVSATGTNVTLTEVTSKPDSGYYVTAQGSGNVSRTAITKSASAGYVTTGASTVSNATSASSNLATKYYTIATESKTVTPKTTSQTVSPSTNKLLSSVTVNAMPSGAYSSSATAEATADVTVSSKGVTLGSPVTTVPTSGNYITVVGSSTAEASSTAQITTAGYLSTGTKTDSDVDTASVTKYYPIDSSFISPSGTYTVSTDGTHDVTAYRYAYVANGAISKPSISINPSGLILASGGVSTAGWVEIADTSSQTKQLSTQGAATITPTSSEQTAVGAGVYTTGAVKVAAIPSSYVEPVDWRDSEETIQPGPYDSFYEPGTYFEYGLTVQGDANLKPENIKAGVSMFGVTGDYVGTDSGGAKYSAMVLTKAFPNTVGSPIPYGFEYDRSLKAMVPQNKGKDNSFALCTVRLNVAETCDVTLEVMNYAEARCDYGIISNLDKYLTQTSSADTTNVKKAFSGTADNKNSIQEVVFSNVSAGTYYFQVKYRKDSSISSDKETFYFRFKEVPFVVYDDEMASARIADIMANSAGDLNIDISNDNTNFAFSYETHPGEEILPSKIIKGKNILGVVGTAGRWSRFGYQIAGMSELTFTVDNHPTRAMKITIPDLTGDQGGTWRLSIEDDDGWHTLNDIRNGTIYVMDTIITAYIFRTIDTSNRPAVFEYDMQWENISVYPAYTLSSGWTQTIDVKYFTYG